MEDQPIIRLFNDLDIEDEAQAHLAATAGYARYTGFATIAYASLIFFKFVYTMVKTLGVLGGLEYYFEFPGIISLFIELLGVAIYFAIGLFTIRFANKMKSSVELVNQQHNDEAWYNLKMAYRICGLLAIVCILLILFSLLVFGMRM